MGNTEAITPKSDRYIRRWQYKRALEVDTGQLTRFRRIGIGKKFTLPGGSCEQTKLTAILAVSSTGQLMSYKGWEKVVPL